MRLLSTGCAALAVLGLLAGGARAQGRGDQWDDKAVERAIQRAVGYLWSQWRDGHWPEPAPNANGIHSVNYGGRTALCAYALLAAGVRPQDARMKRTLEWLASVGPQQMRGTYARALRANVWAMLGRDSKYREQLKEDVAFLVWGVDARGGYDYVPHGRRQHGKGAGKRPRNVRYDNSNSQLAVLGVWAGSRCGLEVPEWYWKMTERHWVQDQQNDGGWSYQRGGSSYGSMSVAGVATMFICFDALYSDKFIRCAAKSDYPPIIKGLTWLDRNFSAGGNPNRGRSHYYYYLYGVERVGLASGYKYFGKKDWYKLGTSALLARQGGGGNWRSIVETSFALLFLARGRHPILFNKLNYPGTWNSRPRDLANLTRWVSDRFERTVHWQIVHLGAAVSELHDAPILYISGASAPRFTDEDIAKLREFVHQGGVILSEAACNKAAFTLAMTQVYHKMFPDYELKRLPAEHPIYNLHFKVSTGRGLSAVSNGVRLLAIHAPAELSLAWQLNRTATSPHVFHLGANIYFYVTDKGILPPRGVSRWPTTRDFTPVETLRVVPVRHGGNWNPEPLAWKRFAILMGNRHKVRVDLAPPTALVDLDAGRCPAAVMTGTTSFELTDAEAEAVRKFLTAGGTLVVDAAGGSRPFAEAAEKQFRELLPESQYRLIPAAHALYTKVGPVISRVTYRRKLRLAVYDPKKPRLRAITHNGRLAVIFSPDDLTGGLVGYPLWGMRGYEGESAFELMRNILLYASGKSI